MGLLLWSAVRRPVSDNQETAEGQNASIGAMRTASSEVFETDPLDPATAIVTAVIQAASVGDVDAYLDCFRAPLRARLDQEIAEVGRADFAARMKSAAEARRSHAVFEPTPDGPDAASVLVESVFLDRNERRTFRLNRLADGWKIVEVESTRSQNPKVKYGSPATSVGPEGPPVQKGPGPAASGPR